MLKPGWYFKSCVRHYGFESCLSFLRCVPLNAGLKIGTVWVWDFLFLSKNLSSPKKLNKTQLILFNTIQQFKYFVLYLKPKKQEKWKKKGLEKNPFLDQKLKKINRVETYIIVLIWHPQRIKYTYFLLLTPNFFRFSRVLFCLKLN